VRAGGTRTAKTRLKIFLGLFPVKLGYLFHCGKECLRVLNGFIFTFDDTAIAACERAIVCALASAAAISKARISITFIMCPLLLAVLPLPF
jgi:hypothetical protein